jgi:hypothetical protein
MYSKPSEFWNRKGSATKLLGSGMDAQVRTGFAIGHAELELPLF